MSGFHLGRNKTKHVVIVDVGSASAAVGVMRVSGDGPSAILTAQRAFIPYEKRTSEQFAARISSAIGEAATKAQQAYSVRKDRHSAIPEAYIFLRSPRTEAKMLKYTSAFDVETKITKAHLDEVTKQVLTGTEKVLEAIVIRTEVNGYHTLSPLGKTGMSLTVYALVSTIEEQLQSMVGAALEKVFPQAKPKWRSRVRALLTAMREKSHEYNDGLVIDMSSESTTFLTIREGILDKQMEFEFGMHTILERLSKSSLPEETLGLIRMIEKGQCSSEGCQALKASMEKLESELIREFGEKLGALAGTGRLPQDLHLFAHPDIAPWLMRFFSKIDFSQFTVPLQPFTVRELSAKDIQDWVQTESIGADMSLMLSASLVHIETKIGE